MPAAFVTSRKIPFPWFCHSVSGPCCATKRSTSPLPSKSHTATPCAQPVWRRPERSETSTQWPGPSFRNSHGPPAQATLPSRTSLPAATKMSRSPSPSKSKSATPVPTESRTETLSGEPHLVTTSSPKSWALSTNQGPAEGAFGARGGPSAGAWSRQPGPASANTTVSQPSSLRSPWLAE